MARDIRSSGQGSAVAGTGSGNGNRILSLYLSGWSIGETGAAAATCRIRDGLTAPATLGLTQGAAGNVDVGVHMYYMTWETVWGEGVYNPANRVETTIAASAKHVSVTIPVYGGAGSAKSLAVGGRNIYRTKAGAPATGVTPTNAQLFLITAKPSTTIAAASTTLPLPQATINITSSANFAAAGGNAFVVTDRGKQLVAYTAAGGNQLTGCTGGSGIMTTGNAVTQSMIPDNTSVTFDDNVADGSMTANAPPTKDTAGEPMTAVINLAALQTVGDDYPNVDELQYDAVYMEVTAGLVNWTLRGQ